MVVMTTMPRCKWDASLKFSKFSKFTNRRKTLAFFRNGVTAANHGTSLTPHGHKNKRKRSPEKIKIEELSLFPMPSTLTPWRDASEWSNVCAWVMSGEAGQWRKANEVIQIWKERVHRLPMGEEINLYQVMPGN